MYLYVYNQSLVTHTHTDIYIYIYIDIYIYIYAFEKYAICVPGYQLSLVRRQTITWTRGGLFRPLDFSK